MNPAGWLPLIARWLNPRRIRAHALILALCLWAVCAADFSTRGLFDRGRNLKFQDFLPLYISGRLVAQHRSADLFDATVRDRELLSIVGQPTRVRLANVYGPQAALLSRPLASLPFLRAGFVWAGLNVLLYFGCIYALWRHLPELRRYGGSVLIAAFAFPPLFHFFVRGQMSVVVLLCFTLAFLAFRMQWNLLAGVALGCLVLKPQFLVALPIILLLSQSWSVLAGLILSASAQLGFAWLYFGPVVMKDYFGVLLHPSQWIGVAELSLAPIQMHSLRSFWSLLIPSHRIALALYLLCSVLVVAVAVIIWKSRSDLAARYSALILAAVLINPHLFVYDLLVLAPALLALADWALAREHTIRSAFGVLLYLAFVLPLLGPLSRWTHLQLSVVAFAALLGLLYRATTRQEVLASRESVVV